MDTSDVVVGFTRGVSTAVGEVRVGFDTGDEGGVPSDESRGVFPT